MIALCSLFTVNSRFPPLISYHGDTSSSFEFNGGLKTKLKVIHPSIHQIFCVCLSILWVAGNIETCSGPTSELSFLKLVSLLVLSWRPRHINFWCWIKRTLTYRYTVPCYVAPPTGWIIIYKYTENEKRYTYCIYIYNLDLDVNHRGNVSNFFLPVFSFFFNYTVVRLI